jgi:RNA polymerase sigma factor for flagellar operon FliA
MIDWLRQSHRAPRTLPRRLREIATATCRIENETGCSARPPALAASLGLSLAEYHRIGQDALASQTVDTEYRGADEDGGMSRECADDAVDVVDRLALEEWRQILAAAIDVLPEPERAVILLSFGEGRMLHEIGDLLELSESRICQIRRNAVRRLRAILAKRHLDESVLRTAHRC